MVKTGVLKPHPSSKSTVKNRLFRMSDIAAVQEIRSRGANPEAAFVEARQASMEVQILRKDLEKLRYVLGVDMPMIDTSRDTVVCMMLEAEDALRAMPSQDPAVLLKWAKTLHSLSEAHLESITFHSEQKEPWKSFLNLGRHLLSGHDPQITRYDIELHNIYMLLTAGLKKARQTAYFHVRTLYGKEYAARIMPEVKGCPHEDVIAMSFNNMAWEAPANLLH